MGNGGDSSLKLQNYFSLIMLNNSHSKFLNSLLSDSSNRLYLTWYTSVDTPSSGAFLFATPKTLETNFRNHEFSKSLCLRLHLPIPCISPNVQCSCSAHPVVDRFGHHWIEGCQNAGTRQSHHSNVQNILSTIFSFSGLRCKVEKNHCFKGADPLNNKRPDITIENAHILGYNTALHIDISIASPLVGAQSGNFQTLSTALASQSFRAADKRVYDKNKKYKEDCYNNSAAFLPFVLETSGAIHPSSAKFIKQISCIGAQNNNIPYNIFRDYVTKTLSCVLQKSIAQQIHIRNAKHLISHNTAALVDFNMCGWKTFLPSSWASKHAIFRPTSFLV